MDKKRGDSMIEIICRENQQETQEIKLPKNIRQVGSPKGRHKIYIEDYVYTYLKNQAKENQKSAAVLLGKSSVSRDIRYTFVYGAVECGQAIFQFDSIYLDESFWQYIAAEGQEYFPDLSIVGWFVGEQGEGMPLSATVESAHRKYFAGRDKVLMLMDAEEEEELFYIYEQGYLQRREGFYIYFEKNVAMQEYMIRKKDQQELDFFQNQEILKEPEDSREAETFEKSELSQESEFSGRTEFSRKAELSGRTGFSRKSEFSKETGFPRETEFSKETGFSRELEFSKGTELSRELEFSKETELSRRSEFSKEPELSRELEFSEEPELSREPEFYQEHAKKAQDSDSEWESLREEIREEPQIFVKSSAEEPISGAEKALQDYRQAILEKRGHKVERQNRKLLYGAASFFMIAFCIVGITTMNNYKKMKEVENALYVMKGETKKDESSDLVVESVASDVTPLEDNQTSQQSADSQSAADTQQSADAQQAMASPQQSPDSQQGTEAQQTQPAQPTADGQQQNTASTQQTQPAQPAADGQQQSTAETQQTQPAQPAAEPQYYTVQAGDTLESICLKIYQDKSKVAELCQANGIANGNQIQAGQKLILP